MKVRRKDFKHIFPTLNQIKMFPHEAKPNIQYFEVSAQKNFNLISQAQYPKNQ
jgi:hypothetical protein